MNYSNDDRYRQLEVLKTRLLEANPCPELAAQATQLVMGDGNTNANIVFIGEAPGKREDEQGKPFVGTSGKMLDKMLESIGLRRQDIYITNIVKYRPPNNRDPLAEEKKAFLPYLSEQLAIIQPKLIVTLGRHSMDVFLPKEKIGLIHGRSITKEVILPDGQRRDYLIMPLYHPAAALYNGALRATLLTDFKKLQEYI